MKKLIVLSVYGGLFLFGCQHLQAQSPNEKPRPTSKQFLEEEDEGPSMFKFEPDILAKAEAKKARIELARKILDTMDIPERRKRKLLKDLYKNGVTDRLSKSVLADINFEDYEVVDD